MNQEPQEDVLDDAERWDLKQKQRYRRRLLSVSSVGLKVLGRAARIAQEDPDAVAFYTARMQVQRRHNLGGRGAGGHSPSRRRSGQNRSFY